MQKHGPYTSPNSINLKSSCTIAFVESSKFQWPKSEKIEFGMRRFARCFIPSHIPSVRNMIAARQADFIGNMIWGLPDWPLCNKISVCCDHKQQVGRPQTMGGGIMVENLRLLFQDVNTVNIDCFGSLQDWIYEAFDKQYLNQLIACLLYPSTPLSEHPEAWGPLPSWHAQWDTSSQHPADHDGNNDDDEDGNDDSHNNRNNNDNESWGCGYQQPPPHHHNIPPTRAATN